MLKKNGKPKSQILSFTFVKLFGKNIPINAPTKRIPMITISITGVLDCPCPPDI